MKIKPTAGPGPGIWPDNDEVVVTAREAVTAGDLVSFNILNTDGAVSNNIVGDPASGLSNVLVGEVTDVTESIVGVALEDIADNAQGRVQIAGVTPATVVNGGTAAGEPLTAGVDGAMALAVDAQTIWAYDLDGTDPGRVLLDGINGFGQGTT